MLESLHQSAISSVGSLLEPAPCTHNVPDVPTTTPVCPENEVYDDCKIRCDQLCHYFDGFLKAQGFCQVSQLI